MDRLSDVASAFTSPAPPPDPVTSRGGVARSSLSRSLSDTTAAKGGVPSPSNATPTLRTGSSEVSTALSSTLYQGLSSLWLQVLLSKLVLHIYGRDQSEDSSGALREGEEPGSGDDVIRGPPIRVSVEVDGVSLQLDVQERCTDFIFKVSGVECSLSRQEVATPLAPPPNQHARSQPIGHGRWVPYLKNSNGKLFSSTSSNLPEDVLQSTSPSLLLGHYHQGAGPVVGGMGSKVAFSPSFRPPGAKFQPVFLYLKGHLPGKGQLGKRPSLELTVCDFEAVVWLPVWGVVSSALTAGRRDGGRSLHQVSETIDCR